MRSPVSNNEIKFVKSLSHKKFRDENDLFVVEGEKMVEEAVRSSFEVRRIYRSEEIGDTAMERMSLLSSPSPALALVKKPDDMTINKFEEDSLPSKGLFLALDGIRDPGNLGTIIRIADWFGIDAVYASPDTVDIFNPKVVQSTMGAIFRSPVPLLRHSGSVQGRRIRRRACLWHISRWRGSVRQGVGNGSCISVRHRDRQRVERYLRRGGRTGDRPAVHSSVAA